MRAGKMDDVLKEIDFSDLLKEDETSKGTTLSIYIPADYKPRFDDLQRKTKRRFGKEISKLFVACIDRALKEKAS